MQFNVRILRGIKIYSGPPPKALNDSESVSGQRIQRTNRSQHLRDRRVSSEFALLRTRGWYPLARPYPGSWSGQRQLYYSCCTFSGPDFSPITFNVSTGRRAREPDYHVPRQRPVDLPRDGFGVRWCAQEREGNSFFDLPLEKTDVLRGLPKPTKTFYSIDFRPKVVLLHCPAEHDLSIIDLEATSTHPTPFRGLSSSDGSRLHSVHL